MREAFLTILILGSLQAMAGEYGLVSAAIRVQNNCIEALDDDFKSEKKKLISADALTGQQLCVLTHSYHMAKARCINEFNSESRYVSLDSSTRPHYLGQILQSNRRQVETNKVNKEYARTNLGGYYDSTEAQSQNYSGGLEKCLKFKAPTASAKGSDPNVRQKQANQYDPNVDPYGSSGPSGRGSASQ